MLSTPCNIVRPLRATQQETPMRDPPRSPCRQDTPFCTPNCKPSPPPQPPTPERKTGKSGSTTPLTPSQSNLHSPLKSLQDLMFPKNDVLDHLAGRDLLQCALNGCPVDCGSNWSYKQLLAAITNGPHASANMDEAVTACRKEAMDRVAEGCCGLVYWDDIKDNIPPNLKILPIAAIPHKSREFRMILNLSFKLLLNGKRVETVNEASDKASALQHAMFEIRICHTTNKKKNTVHVLKSRLNRRILENGSQRGGRMELRIRSSGRKTGGPGTTSNTRCPPNGMVRITTVFLCSIRNRPRCYPGRHGYE
jgi:hypothetical protein